MIVPEGRWDPRRPIQGGRRGDPAKGKEKGCWWNCTKKERNTLRNCAENVMTQKSEGEKRAKTRENERLTYAKLKKSKIFQKVLDKENKVCYNMRRG
jgi:hypothetical protein